MSESDGLSAAEWEDLDYQKAREIDESVDHDQAVKMAFTKLVNRLGTQPEEEVGPMEAAYRTINEVDKLNDRVTRIEDKLDKIDRDAQTALATAETEAKQGDSVSKVNIAKLLSRNELLRRLANTSSKTQSITVPDVQQMAKPETKLYYQTVSDAWEDKLVTQWGAFSTGTNENGEKVLRVDQDDLSPALVKTVEKHLDRDDLTKRLLSEPERGAL